MQNEYRQNNSNLVKQMAKNGYSKEYMIDHYQKSFR
jgi:hypothetical protein